jgi:hypothetical protein
MTRQANSHDCGVMVAACTEWIVSQFLSGTQFPWDAAGTRRLAPALLCPSFARSELSSFLCHGDGSSYRLKYVCCDLFGRRTRCVYVFAEWLTCSWGGTAASEAIVTTTGATLRLLATENQGLH